MREANKRTSSKSRISVPKAIIFICPSIEESISGSGFLSTGLAASTLEGVAGGLDFLGWVATSGAVGVSCDFTGVFTSSFGDSGTVSAGRAVFAVGDFELAAATGFGGGSESDFSVFVGVFCCCAPFAGVVGADCAVG
jgi:hypothetical protein